MGAGVSDLRRGDQNNGVRMNGAHDFPSVFGVAARRPASSKSRLFPSEIDVFETIVGAGACHRRGNALLGVVLIEADRAEQLTRRPSERAAPWRNR